MISEIKWRNLYCVLTNNNNKTKIKQFNLLLPRISLYIFLCVFLSAIVTSIVVPRCLLFKHCFCLSPFFIYFVLCSPLLIFLCVVATVFFFLFFPFFYFKKYIIWYLIFCTLYHPLLLLKYLNIHIKEVLKDFILNKL